MSGNKTRFEQVFSCRTGLTLPETMVLLFQSGCNHTMETAKNESHSPKVVAMYVHGSSPGFAGP